MDKIQIEPKPGPEPEPKPSVDLSTIKEPQIKRVDDKQAVRYRVVAEPIDLEALRREKEALEEILNMHEPSEEELIELGKSHHPFYIDKTNIQKRIDKINNTLGEGIKWRLR